MNTVMPIFKESNWLDPEAAGDKMLWDHLLSDLMAPLASETAAEWVPAIDVSENENEYKVRAELPGLDKKDIDISLTDGILTIKGEKKEEKNTEKENYHFRETRFGSFTRSLRLPDDASVDNVDATFANGVLNITVPKTEASKPRKINVS